MVKAGRDTLSYRWKSDPLFRGSLPLKEDSGRRTFMTRLAVISGEQAQARWRVILKVARGQPIRSTGHLTFECGSCGAVVLENVALEQIRDCAVECDCGAFNETTR
jgi:hypothetical protein